MYKHLLIATDGSSASKKAVFDGLPLAKALAAQATVVIVTESWNETAYTTVPSRSMIEVYEKAAAGNAAATLDAVKQRAREAGIACKTLLIRDQHPPDGIIKAARDQGCDVIVVGTHGRGPVGRALLGSTSLKVLTLSSVPVLVCR
jgi:nucleotide-binding universal stress UspA family protein